MPSLAGPWPYRRRGKRAIAGTPVLVRSSGRSPPPIRLGAHPYIFPRANGANHGGAGRSQGLSRLPIRVHRPLAAGPVQAVANARRAARAVRRAAAGDADYALDPSVIGAEIGHRHRLGVGLAEGRNLWQIQQALQRLARQRLLLGEAGSDAWMPRLSLPGIQGGAKLFSAHGWHASGEGNEISHS